MFSNTPVLFSNTSFHVKLLTLVLLLLVLKLMQIFGHFHCLLVKNTHNVSDADCVSVYI